MIYIFDFDGVISAPCFNSEEGTILAEPNDFKHNIRKTKACYDEYSKPFMPIINIIKRLKKEGNRILILSSCSSGSQEIFAKLDFLDKYMPGVVDRNDFWGVNDSCQKGIVLDLLFEQSGVEGHGDIVYVDDNLESLIAIEEQCFGSHGDIVTAYKEILDSYKYDTLRLYHVTTFLNKFSDKDNSGN